MQRLIFILSLFILAIVGCSSNESHSFLIRPDGGGEDAATEIEVGKTIPAWQEGVMDIHFINTTTGESMFVIFPDGTQMLIDAASSSVTTNSNSNTTNTGIRSRWDQIVQKYNPAKYPTAKVQNVAVNGEIWTGSGTTTKKTFPELSEITYENSKNITSSDNCPPENITSCVMKVSYGNFDFFAGGDLQYNGRSSHAWKDAELPCAKAVGQVELLKANHHGVTNTNQVDALKALNPQTIVVNSWVDCHPRTDILNSMETTLPACDMFITNFWQGDRPSGVDDRVTAEEAARVKGYDGHIVVRVTDGGNKYRVVTITDSDGAMTVKTISGPYTSR